MDQENYHHSGGEQAHSGHSFGANDRPMAVVKVLSVRGIEYAMMSFALWIGAASLIWLFDSLIMGSATFMALSYPISALIIALPVFALFFLRLRKAELADSSLRFEPSKRRFSQITQFVAFLTCFFNVITFVYTLVNKFGGEVSTGELGKTAGTTAVTLVIAGGILLYYWFDEHKFAKKA